LFTSDPRERPNAIQVGNYIKKEYKELNNNIIGVINPELFNKNSQS